VRFTKSQTSFKSGRLSPKLYSRIDTSQYKDGAAVLKGFKVIPEGGAETIKGKRWINDSLYSPNVGFEDSKLISFVIGTTQISVALVSNQFNEVTAYIYKYPYTNGTEVAVQIIAAGGLEYDPELFDFAVSDNYLILTHFTGKLTPRYIKFDPDTGDFESLKVLANNALQSPYSDLQDSSISIGNLNVGANTVDLTSSDPDVAALLQSKVSFYAEGLGSRVNGGDNRRYSFVASNFYAKQSDIANGVRVLYNSFYTSSSGDEESLVFAGISTINVWAYNLWGAGNWPKSVTSHEGRIVFGGSVENPMSLVGSSVSSIFNFRGRRNADTGSTVYLSPAGAGDLLTTDPYYFTVSADEDSEITAVRSATDLFIGTDRREYIASGGDSILSATNAQIKPYTSQGVYPISTVTMGNVVAYIDSARKKLFQFKYNDSNGTFLSDELSLLFADLVEGDRLQQLLWAPHVKVLYILTSNEILYGITYDPSSETQAFFETLQTGVTSISYVAARDEEVGETHHRGDHLLMFVRGKGLMAYEQTFYENGIAESYIKEERTEANEYMYLEDVYEISRDGASAYNINGEAYATGVDLFPVPIGAPVFAPPFRAMNLDTKDVVTVESLAPDGINPWFSIDDPALNGASKILIGNIPTYEKVLSTMPIEAGQQWGSAQMGIKNVDELGIRFYKSYSYSISSNGVDWQDVRVADKLGNANTGREETKFSSNPKYDFRVWIKSTKPEPLTITGINMRGVSNDG